MLVLGRNQANKLWTTYETGNESNQMLNSQDIGLEWKWGGEVRFGRRFCCDQWALEATYWTVDNFEGSVQGVNPNGFVSTTLTVGWVNFDGDPNSHNGGTMWFDGALRHRLQRRDEFHNVELNLVRFSQPGLCSSCWDVDWLLGVRYFRFEENLLFSTEANPNNLPDPVLTDPNAFLEDNITNSLAGFQFGCNIDYTLLPGWRLFAAPRFGIYNNHIRHYFNAGLSDGTIAVPDVGSGQTGSYPVNSSVDVVSFLTQFDVGVQWQFNPCWTVEAGYRVVAATGIGLADNQIPQQVVAIDELADIDRNGELILHGAFVGMTYNY